MLQKKGIRILQFFLTELKEIVNNGKIFSVVYRLAVEMNRRKKQHIERKRVIMVCIPVIPSFKKEMAIMITEIMLKIPAINPPLGLFLDIAKKTDHTILPPRAAVANAYMKSQKLRGVSVKNQR